MLPLSSEVYSLTTSDIRSSKRLLGQPKSIDPFFLVKLFLGFKYYLINDSGFD
jgi:hypothetical protein